MKNNALLLTCTNTLFNLLCTLQLDETRLFRNKNVEQYARTISLETFARGRSDGFKIQINSLIKTHFKRDVYIYIYISYICIDIYCSSVLQGISIWLHLSGEHVCGLIVRTLTMPIKNTRTNNE